MEIICPKCGSNVRIPRLWVLGVELVFLCPECKHRFKTGYKVGAVLFAFALTLALVTANLGAWIFSSYSIPIMVLAVIPLWLLYGFWLRRWWLIRRNRPKQSTDTHNKGNKMV